MTEAEFEVFLADAIAELEQKQNILETKYGLGHGGRWWFDQATAKLQFFDIDDHLTAEADVIDVGSYSPKSNTWKWAWSNDSVLLPLRQKAETLKELQRITGIQLFGQQDAFEVADEAMAWELTAMSVKHLGAIGAYRGPSSTGGPTVFLAITTIRTYAP